MKRQESAPAVEPGVVSPHDAAPAGADAVPSWKPELCESCAAGAHRSYCPTFPRPCEDLIEIYESGFAAGRAEQREADAKLCDAYAEEMRIECEHDSRWTAADLAKRIREST